MKKLLFVLLGVCLVNLAQAQATWTKATVPTTANLWGACYGAAQFVVVGDAGTILTSPDGTTWTQRTSGTTAWLNGVAWSGSLYVAVGDTGTILTSPDAVTWTARATGGDRLNGIAYGDGRFVAVGENGVVRASVDGIAWTTARIPVGTWLRGVCYAADHFVIGGGDGTMCSTEDGLVFRFMQKLTTSVEALHFADARVTIAGGPAMLYSDLGEQLWSASAGNLRGLTWTTGPLAVGTGGVVVVGAVDRDFPSSTTVRAFTLSGGENLNAVAAGPRGNVVAGEAGTIYFQTVTPTALSILRIDISPARYAGATVTLDPRILGAAPFTCQWSRNGRLLKASADGRLVIRHFTDADAGEYQVSVTNGAGTVTALATLAPTTPPPSLLVDPNFAAGLRDAWASIEPLPNGQLLVWERSGYCWRLNADGSWDLGFKPALRPASIALQSDGKLLADVYMPDEPSPKLVRLELDGSLDRTFSAADSAGSPIPLPNGSILRVNSDNYSEITVARLNRSGTRDASFTPVTVPLAYPTPYYGGTGVPYAFDATGRIYVCDTRFPFRGGLGASLLLRLNPDGSLDRSFEPHKLDFSISELWAIGEKLGYDTGSDFYSSVSSGHTFGRLSGRGDIDDSYPRRSYGLNGIGTRYVAGSFDGDGGLFVVDDTNYHDIVRYDASGQRDPGFSARLELGGGVITGLMQLPDGSLLAEGTFTSVNGVPTAGLARLRIATHDPATRLANLSIRTTAGVGDQTLIAGFVIGGTTGSRSLLIRGVGPGLMPMGLPASEVVADPWFTLFRRGAPITASDNWDALVLAATANAVGAYPLAPGSLDAGLLETLMPGAYTVHMRSQDSDAKIALVELYDADPAPGSADSARLVNISGRAHVGTGSNVLIAGFVVTGESTRRVLVRGVGPGLVGQGVTGVLANPELLIHRSGVVVAANDDWDPSLGSVFRSVGAFALTEGSRDAALVVDLPAGVYTATVRGVGDTTGNAMIEVYELP
jgi:hypothetical protein